MLKPEKIMAEFGRRYPGCWKQLEGFALSRGQGGLPDWPEWCYVPVAGSYAVISGGGGNKIHSPQQMLDLAMLHVLGAWRLTQGVYRFDPELYAQLTRTPFKDELPVDLFFNLPEWGIYLELQSRWFDGVFVALEYDANDSHRELRLVFVAHDVGVYPVFVHLVPGVNTEQALDEALEYAAKQMSGQDKKLMEVEEGGRVSARQMLEVEIPEADNSYGGRIARAHKELPAVLSLVLYLCSSRPDIESRGQGPRRPAPVKTKKGPRYFPAKKPVEHLTGYRIGRLIMQARDQAQVREDRGGKEHGSPVAHIRRAHWHLYWTGPRKQPESQKAVLRWIPPTPVGFKWEDGVDGPVIKRVSG